MSIDYHRGSLLIAAPNALLDRNWIEQTLTPYLRHAFSHAIPYDADIVPQIQRAIDFCMSQAARLTDGDDLLFERVCLAIEFRHNNLAPDLSILTQNLESLAKFLIRRVQLKGPYELLGRMNIGSGAWREYEHARIENLKETAEMERKARPLLDPPTPHKAVPTEDQIDPRLVNAQSGQFVSPYLSGALSSVEDHYFRHQHRGLEGYSQKGSVPRPEQTQCLMSPPPKRPLGRNPGNGSAYDKQLSFDSGPVGSQGPAYEQNLEQRQFLPTHQPQVSKIGAHDNSEGSQHVFRVPLSTATMVEPPGPTHLYILQRRTTFRHQPVPPQRPSPQHSGIEAESLHGLNLDPPFYTRPNNAEPSKITHLRGDEWDEVAQRRADAFNFLS